MSDARDTPDLTVVIGHYAPEERYRAELIETVANIRAQRFDGRIEIAVGDDGSVWSQGLLTDGASRRLLDRDGIQGERLLHDLDVDWYCVQRTENRYYKAVLWNEITPKTSAPLLVYLDDDHAFQSLDALERYRELLGRYDFVMGRLRNPRGWYRSYYDHKVQGTNFGMKRSVFEAAGGFGDYTREWGRGEDSDIFWKVYSTLRKNGDVGHRACFAGDLVTVDRCSGRWHNCIGSREEAVAGFKAIHGVELFDNPSRDKGAWMEHTSAFPRLDEAGYRLRNYVAGVRNVALRALGRGE